VITIDPRGMTAIDWIDTMADMLSGSIPMMIVRDGDEWKQWGYHVRQTLSLRGILTPDPDTYEKWDDWAFRFNQVIGPRQEL
jgi:hypothetical protein